ncbi:MAG TPA: SUMF1/EgtB/PvdO family nonheme iron enzyme, partial [Thermotogota bacterium]|nr:SUMF1/EgtB/PvdO family nonheme iron enzyme [Thermotogota bacterium]
WMGNTRGDEDGHPNEEPVHKVTFTYDFWVSPYQLTFEEYDLYCLDTGRPYPGDNGWGRDTRPVINVSWWDAIRYCNWKSEQMGFAPAYNETSGGLLDAQGNPTTDITQVEGYRLPTEAEWEFCARGGTADITGGVEEHDYKYAGSNNPDEVAWYGEKWGQQTHPVGEKQANELGLYDMSGNIWEYCHDWFSEDWYNRGEQTNPIGPSNGEHKSDRGGSWNSPSSHCRVVFRGHDGTNDPKNIKGFRIARTN